MRNRSFSQNVQTISLFKSFKKPVIKKSYSGSAMAICVSPKNDFSVDVEEQKFRRQETIRHFIEKFKSFDIKCNSTNINLEWFYRTWTSMESYFKLTGYGFKTLKNFTLDLQTKSIHRNGETVAFFEFIYFRNYIVCLCSSDKIHNNDLQINCYGWS
jgi:phosphopantetheinyl transferase